MPAPNIIAGFSVLPVRYNPSSRHYLYLRPHQKGSNSPSNKALAHLPDGRTLFVVNLPPDATQREISLFFKSCGTVERVIFGKDLGQSGVDEDEDDEGVDEDEDEETEWVPPSERQQEEDGDASGPSSSKSHKKRRIDKTKVKSDIPIVTPLPSLPDRVLRSTGHSAHVVFLDDSSLTRALAFAKTSSTSKKCPSWPPSGTLAEPSGLQYYLTLHTALHPPLAAVRTHADTSIELYEYKLAKSKVASKYKKGDAIVDEDGFTLVTRGGAYGKTLGGGVGVASKTFDAAASEKKKKKKKEKERFYTFQLREQKRQEFMDLRRKFEEDKKKIAQLKESRRFRPY